MAPKDAYAAPDSEKRIHINALRVALPGPLRTTPYPRTRGFSSA